MKPARLGKATSEAEVLNISPHGFWLLVGGREIYLSFAEFPWFREAKVADLLSVELPNPDHLYWPNLDVDVSVESIDNPERSPLISRAAAKNRSAGRPRAGS